MFNSSQRKNFVLLLSNHPVALTGFNFAAQTFSLLGLRDAPGKKKEEI